MLLTLSYIIYRPFDSLMRLKMATKSPLNEICSCIKIMNESINKDENSCPHGLTTSY